MSEHAARVYRAARFPALPGVFWLCVMVPAGRAQPTTPQGWTSQTVGNAIVFTAPAIDSSPRPALTLLPPGHLQGDAKRWFGNQVLSLARAVGTPLGATEVVLRDTILVRVVQIENQRHHKVRLAFYGYPTANGLSVAVLTIPDGVGDQDSRLETANHYVQQVAAQKFEVAAALSPTGTAATSPVPAQNSRGQYVGPPGRTDIDLTYHAKAIPPKDRDVPLKGVYLFAGIANGASYGGVGTTMTFGPHAVQQLLLLYANGVAAKVDALGNNLVGHHQAEGFATLDVGDPSTVSGTPFGRWTEDSSAVHIQWNGGSASELAKSGANLDGPGERWTPYILADGQVPEGTFVRKMEAGLRSQWIVLKRDGTFTGDGVSVALGGSIVNPAFPDHGSGAYEIRKGSMILYFANGYTQAIACVLAPLSGEVQTVLLNGFPFERVR